MNENVAVPHKCGDQVMIGIEDDEAPLQRVPFALLDVESRCDDLPKVDSRSCLPGVILESTTELILPTSVLWRSSASEAGGFPRELALRVLSCVHYRVHAIRIVFPKARRPSRLEVSAASGSIPSDKRGHTSQSLDVLSQYFCGTFDPIGSPLSWSPESALDWLLSPTEVTIPITSSDKWQLQMPQFIKFVFHRPHPHPENPRNEVAISELELLGAFQLPGRSIPLVEDALISSEPVEPLENAGDVDDIRGILEAAGLSEELIQELLQATGETPESVRARVIPLASEPASDLPHTAPETTEPPEYLLDSVFDLALRDFIAHKRHQDELFASLTTPRQDLHAITNESELGRAASLASIQQNDRNHLEAIATHTFGSFFTQCLVDEDSELRLTSLQVSERFAPLLVLAGLRLELVYEGLVTVVLLATESQHRTVSLSAFHAALHLVQTIFQERNTSFRLVSELPKGKINTGTQSIVEALIQLPHCWSLGAKTTINRELLKTARLLLSQEMTRTSFTLAVCQPRQGSTMATDPLATINRLRLMRWLLQRHREKLSVDDLEGIRSVCDQNNGSGSMKAVELTDQIKSLMRPTKPAKGDLNAQLQAMRRHLHGQDASPNADQANNCHVPLFEEYPLTKQEQELYIDRLRQYLQLHPRPTALYQHEFTMQSLEDHATRGEFRKGNIVFKGQVEQRSVPVVSFHKHVENIVKPVQFNAPRADGAASITLETPFARFRGTMEERMTQPTPDPTVQIQPVGTTRPSASPRTPSSNIRMPPTAQPRQPSPPVVRRPSNPKLNRVVPVESTLGAHSEVTPPTSGGDTVAVDLPVVKPIISEQRASTAAPLTAMTRAPTVGAASTIVDPAPTASPTKKVLPKTAPAGKSRSSTSQADTGASGCSVQ